MAGVLVFCERQNGKIKKTSREALTIGRKLAEASGVDLIAFGAPTAADASLLLQVALSAAR